MTDKNTLDLARQWAAGIDADRQTLSQDMIDAAAEVIQSLPEAIADGDKVREVINAQLDGRPHGTVGHHVAEELACKLQALLPAPEPQVEIKLGAWAMHPEHGKVLICSTHADEDLGVRVALADPPVKTTSGHYTDWVDPADLSPLSDTDTEPKERVYAPGGVVVQEALDKLNTPEPQPGECWLIDVAGTEYSAVRNFSEAGCEWSANDDDGGYLFDSSEVRLIRRLVPEQQPHKNLERRTP